MNPFWATPLGQAYQRVATVIIWLAVLAVVAFGLKWAFTEYWISTHCTTVLGTRVCQ